MQIFAPIRKDAYKIGHKDQYAPGTEYVYSNLTARSGKHSNIKNSEGVIWVGLQFVIKDVLINNWNDTFFSQPKHHVVGLYQHYVSKVLGYTVSVEHIAELHDLGWLPVEIKALPEGSFVPYRVPMMTIVNTDPKFYWVTNMLETMISAESWAMITSATTYNEYRKVFTKFAIETGSPVEGVPFQGHDFSMRGMSSSVSAAMSGFAALAAGSYGTDTLPAVQLAVDYYGANLDNEIVGMSVNATEHSVMCSNGKDDEIGTFKTLINETYPKGILSIVSDTWDFWQVVTEFLPKLKDDIMSRDGKVVIRPDSGDPVKIITGYTVLEKFVFDDESQAATHATNFAQDTYNDEVFKLADGTYYDHCEDTIYSECEVRGLIECLWDTFGGTINDKDFKVLDEHIGAIYGDSITLERQEQILKRLKDKGFASENIVLGIGSYTYQHVTRDTHGMAIKATYVEINGEGVNIFKDPKTDDGLKKSAKGLLSVLLNDSDEYYLVDEVSIEQESLYNCLKTVFKDGKLIKETSLAAIRARIV